MTRWIALLRGVNVGGGNKIAMSALKSSCEARGFQRVTSYIQSGNLVLDASGDEASVTAVLREVLVEEHGLKVPVVVRTAQAMDRLVDRHPGLQAGVEPKFLHIVFLDKKIAKAASRRIDAARYEPDSFAVDGREIYVTYPQGSGRSKLTIEVFEKAFGVTATARNVNTVHKLVDLARV